MSDPVKAFESALSRHKNAAVSRSLVRQQALKAIRKVRPSTRAQTVKALAQVLIQVSVFLDYLKEATAKYGFDGHTLTDLLGEVMWEYKAAWEIPDNDEWSELSADPVLRYIVEKAVADWEPRDSQLYGWDTLDFAELEGLVGRLEHAVVELKRARDLHAMVYGRGQLEDKLSAAQALVKQISEVLSDDLRKG